MEPHRAIRAALAGILTLFVGFFLCSVIVSVAPRSDGAALGPRVRTTHSGAAVVQRVARLGSAVHVDERQRSGLDERDSGGFPLHASLPPRVAWEADVRRAERAHADADAESPLRGEPSARWAEARAPPVV